MFVMGRRGGKAKGQQTRPAQTRPQNQSMTAVPPQLVVDEPKQPVQDPYGVVRRTNGPDQNGRRRSSLAQMRGDTEPSAPVHHHHQERQPQPQQQDRERDYGRGSAAAAPVQ